MAVRDVDKGYRKLVDTIFKMGAPKVSVGVFDADGAQEAASGLTLVALATIHEFGLGVPERSFLRGWFDENLDRARDAMTRLLTTVVEGKRTKEQALELFGVWLQGEVQKRIAAGIPPELAPQTIARKTRDGKTGETPLIDTGQLRSSITYQIDDGNGNIKTGTSQAAVARHEKAKAAKRDAKTQERKARTARRKEVRAARRKLVKDFRRIKKTATKTVTRAAKNASKDVKRATKRVIKKIR